MKNIFTYLCKKVKEWKANKPVKTIGWATELKCNKCGKKIELPFGSSDNYNCPKCKKSYKIYVNQISHALAESGSCDYHRYISDTEIETRIFRNYPLDMLEEAWQDFQAIAEEEKNPQVLLPIVKKYHDAVKSHVRRLLEINPGILSGRQISIIQKDDDRRRKINITNIFEYLRIAYPSKISLIDSFYSSNLNMIRRVWWVRNKQEHILYSQWPLNAKVFEDPAKDPNDLSPAPDNLNFDFIKRVNNLSVDICKLIIDLRPGTQERWQYSSIEQFRSI